MNKLLLSRWIEALENNKYKQGIRHYKLEIGNEEYFDVCGVLLEELRLLYPRKYKWVRADFSPKPDDPISYTLTNTLTNEWVSPSMDLGLTLGNLCYYNDSGWTFPELAHYIREKQKITV